MRHQSRNMLWSASSQHRGDTCTMLVCGGTSFHGDTRADRCGTCAPHGLARAGETGTFWPVRHPARGPHSGCKRCPAAVDSECDSRCSALAESSVVGTHSQIPAAIQAVARVRDTKRSIRNLQESGVDVIWRKTKRRAGPEPDRRAVRDKEGSQRIGAIFSDGAAVRRRWRPGVPCGPWGADVIST